MFADATCFNSITLWGQFVAVSNVSLVQYQDKALTKYGLGFEEVWLTCQRLKKPSPSATPHCRQTERMKILNGTDNIFSCILQNDSYKGQKTQQDDLPWTDVLLYWTYYITPQTTINTVLTYSRYSVKSTAHEQTLNEPGNYTLHK